MKDDKTYLAHIADALDRIAAFTTEGSQSFMADIKTQDAVVRNFEIIGEASKLVSSDLKKRHPDIPWREMAGTRDRLIHEYFGVSLNMVWQMVEQEVPSLRRQIASLLGR
jgi:uncharacterized protein with HEPN domain